MSKKIQLTKDTKNVVNNNCSLSYFIFKRYILDKKSSIDFFLQICIHKSRLLDLA